MKKRPYDTEAISYNYAPNTQDTYQDINYNEPYYDTNAPYDFDQSSYIPETSFEESQNQTQYIETPYNSNPEFQQPQQQFCESQSYTPPLFYPDSEQNITTYNSSDAYIYPDESYPFYTSEENATYSADSSFYYDNPQPTYSYSGTEGNLQSEYGTPESKAPSFSDTTAPDIDLQGIEQSIAKNITPIFEEAHTIENQQIIDETLDDYETSLVKEVLAALSDPEPSAPIKKATKKPISSSEQVIPPLAHSSTSEEKTKLIHNKETETSSFSDKKKAASQTAATHVPGEILGYTSIAAHSITDDLTDKKSNLKSSLLDDKESEEPIEDIDEEEASLLEVYSFSQWLGTICILLIPFFNLVMLFTWVFGEGNRNRVNFARALLLVITILLLLTIIIFWLSHGVLNDFLPFSA